LIAAVAEYFRRVYVKLTVQGPDSGQLRDAEAGLESLRLGIAALLPVFTAMM
jgi:hypothetical protein